jgi:segregation and condensation protein A
VTLLDHGPVTEAPPRFTVRLDNFTGPFDLLLQLIGKHQLDVTELALHRVTDDFIAHLTALGDDMDLDETSEFLVIAATLLDLKAARLLPDAEANTEDGDDGLLEARDLLFARLLQYRAYKQVAQLFVELEATALRRFPRSVALEDRFAGLLPEVLLGVDPARFADLLPPCCGPAAADRRCGPLRAGRLRRRARRDPAGAARGAGGGDVRGADRRL